MSLKLVDVSKNFGGVIASSAFRGFTPPAPSRLSTVKTASPDISICAGRPITSSI